jgi:hypothetical protein
VFLIDVRCLPIGERAIGGVVLHHHFVPVVCDRASVRVLSQSRDQFRFPDY